MSGPELARMTLPSDQDASGRSLGEDEIALLAEAIRSGTLTSTKGRFVGRFESAFAAALGVPAAVACSSGTAAIHAAVAAIDPEPGSEIITSPITDMGALAPILYQGAIPVFADVDPATCLITPDTIERRVSERTRAIVATHLFGSPCDMTGILRLAERLGLPVIEDCAQAFLARHAGRLVGTFGTVSCFSLQQGKHITTGEGGMVATADPALARRIRLFVNKAWGYGDAEPDHYFLALNYRLTELQGAVGLAQLPKLAGGVDARVAQARGLTARLEGLPGVVAPRVRLGDVHTYWKYCLGVDGSAIPGGAVALGAMLRDDGIPSAPRYIQKPAFMCQVFREQRTFGRSRFPFTLARRDALDWRPDSFPGTFAALERALVLPWTERHTPEHVEHIAAALAHAVGRLRG